MNNNLCKYEMHPKAKLTGSKTVPQVDFRVGTALGETKSTPLTILQWNAGGLTSAKKIELQILLDRTNLDVFCIMETNLTKEQMKSYHFKGYTLYLHPKARQIASGILIGVKDTCINIQHSKRNGRN